MEATITETLRNHLHCADIRDSRYLSSGTVHQCYFYETDKGRYFIKTGPLEWLHHFKAEFEGLQKLQSTDTLHVPQARYYGVNGQHALLVMDFIDLYPHTDKSHKNLGQQLAKMHLMRHTEMYGFDSNNNIGSSSQLNPWTEDWVSFFRDFRLEVHIKMLVEKYQDLELAKLCHPLLEKLPSLFDGLDVYPSLLHGDLWQGNCAADADEKAIIFDPAAYYGHHEAELGIMRMFGGFSEGVFSAYHELIPMAPGFKERQWLYQLYHYLNHYNIFGESYRGSCLECIDSLRVI